ncbi:TPA: GIY-YIG nuclease family protein [Candidatus Dependentiae bacterium]|nr:GIY-YIG nuclease family protein [Candidatus Dependentiae bacterium]HCU00250.1 GIY-YIG nuclease family protein [Candidatus Dependentiae bacterium]
MEFYLYILKCNDESYYIGHTEDLEKRVSEHNMGLYKCYTFNRRPLKLVYAEKFTSRLEVLAAERKIKKWTRQKKERLIMFGWSGFLK